MNTLSKLFCSCKNSTDAPPNTNTCPTCLGHPGSKPVLNQEAIAQALKVALFLNCEINKTMLFSRKTYFFPDLPNNFQITQYELPLGVNGKLNNIRIRRVHIEEDPGRLIHKKDFVLIDYNRSGIPLIEMVTEPDLKNADEAKQFLSDLVLLLESLGVYYRSDSATLRCDVNVSIEGGERVEVKNVNGIHEIKKVIEYEIKRQQKEGAVRETRGWDEQNQITYPMRKKETEEDYGYITEPNLPKIIFSDEDLKEIKDKLPTNPLKEIEDLTARYSINKEDARILVSNKELYHIFKNSLNKTDPIFTAKVLKRDILKILKGIKIKLAEHQIQNLITIISLFETKKITDKIFRSLAQKIIENGIDDLSDYLDKNELLSIDNEEKLEQICRKIVLDNQKVSEDYRDGNEKALNFLIGQTMKITKGKANIETIKKIYQQIIFHI